MAHRAAPVQWVVDLVWGLQPRRLRPRPLTSAEGAMVVPVTAVCLLPTPLLGPQPCMRAPRLPSPQGNPLGLPPCLLSPLSHGCSHSSAAPVGGSGGPLVVVPGALGVGLALVVAALVVAGRVAPSEGTVDAVRPPKWTPRRHRWALMPLNWALMPLNWDPMRRRRCWKWRPSSPRRSWSGGRCCRPRQQPQRRRCKPWVSQGWWLLPCLTSL